MNTSERISPKRPMLIGIAGFLRAGKTSMAEVLEKELGYAHLSFAEPIRKFTTDLLQAVDPTFDLEAHKTSRIGWLDGKTPREIMQSMGTEWGRAQVHPELWLRHTMMRAAFCRENGLPVVISDVRFENEAAEIREQGGLVVWLHRPGCRPAEHASEKGVPAHLVDVTIHNDSTLAQLAKATKGLEHSLAVWQAIKEPFDHEGEVDQERDDEQPGKFRYGPYLHWNDLRAACRRITGKNVRDAMVDGWSFNSEGDGHYIYSPPAL